MSMRSFTKKDSYGDIWKEFRREYGKLGIDEHHLLVVHNRWKRLGKLCK